MKLPRTPLLAFATIVGLAAAAALFILPRLHPRDAPCMAREFEGSRFIVCTYDTRRQDMRLYSRAPGGGYLRSFEALQQELGAGARRVSAPKDLDEDKVKKKTLKLSLEITKLLHNMSVQKKHSIILVLQGMDASGKDGVVKSVFSEMANSIYNVVAFKKPTEEEMAHDFLWRIHKNTPAKGRLVIFNRSHYEDVLIQRVHKWVTEETVANRMNAINSFEENLLKDNGTIMLNVTSIFHLKAVRKT